MPAGAVPAGVVPAGAVPAQAAPDDAPPVEIPRRGRRGALLQVALLAGTAALLVLFRDRLPDLGAMAAAARHAEPGWLVLVVVAAAGSMGAFARLQRRLLRVGGVPMRLRRAFAITYAGNALSVTLPAGPAVSVVYTFRQFRRSGASAKLATAVILLGGVITTTAYTVIGLLALMADPRARGPALTALALFAALAAVPAALLLRPRPRALLSRTLGRPARALSARMSGHPKIAPHAERLREVPRVLRPSRRDWGALVLLAAANWAFDILALLAAARAVGIEVAPHGVTLAYFAAQAAGSALPLLPGGLGAIESSMAASLVAFGATLTPAGAAVGLYRLASYWIVVLVGWLAWLALHEGPRLSARTRRRLAAAGGTVLSGLTSASLLSPYTPIIGAAPPEPRRP
ncbi:lysylphosphatidylglycerol synthase transmembrane domain-containing protein [Spirillospora sp. CA-253888]